MSEVVFAAESINNELSAKDIKTVEQVKKDGSEVHLVYYLYRVPAESTVLPSTQARVSLWHEQAFKRLSELGNKLGIPPEHRHFVDEIIGPDEVFQEARNMHAVMILTHDPNELKPRVLTRLVEGAKEMFQGKHDQPKVVEVRRLEPDHVTYAESGPAFRGKGAAIRTVVSGPNIKQDVGEKKVEDQDETSTQRPKFKP